MDNADFRDIVEKCKEGHFHKLSAELQLDEVHLYELDRKLRLIQAAEPDASLIGATAYNRAYRRVYCILALVAPRKLEEVLRAVP